MKLMAFLGLIGHLGLVILVGFLQVGEIAAELVISAENHRADYFSIYDVVRDKVLPLKLIETGGKVRKNTVITNRFRYKSFNVNSKLDFVEGYEIGGVAKLNMAFALASGSGSVGFGYSESLSYNSKTYTTIIRMSYRTKIESIEVCDKTIGLAAYDDILKPDFDAGRYVVTEKRYGLQLDIIITGTSSASSSSKRSHAQMDLGFETMMAAFNAEGQYSQGFQTEVSQDQLAIDVQAVHVSVPFPEPMTINDVPSYLKNVSDWINKNGTTGGVLEYGLEDLRDVSFCLSGKKSLTSVDFTGADLLMTKVMRAMKKIDEKRADNVLFRNWVRKYERCFSMVEVNELEDVVSNVEDLVHEGRLKLSSSIEDYKKGLSKSEEVGRKVDSVYKEARAGNYSVRDTLTSIQTQKLEFLTTMASYNVTCLERGKNAYFDNEQKGDVRYLIYNSSVLASILNTDIPMSFVTDCINSMSTCKVINCNNNYSLCSSYTLPVIVNKSSLIPADSKYLDLAKESFGYLYNLTYDLDSRINDMNVYISNFHYEVQRGFLLTSVNLRNYWGPSPKSLFVQGGKYSANPINNLFQMELP